MPTNIGKTSDALANQLAGLLWRGDAVTLLPTTTYWGLSTTQPGTDGTNITEPTDTGYALLAVNRDHTTFAAPATRAITTAVAITFAAASSGGAGFGAVGWIPVWDDASRTNFLGFWVIDGGPQTIAAGISPNFPAGSLTWQFPGN